MSDLFEQQGITFESSGMASTAPQAAAKQAMAPADMPKISAAALQRNAPPLDMSGPVPPPPDPEAIAQRLSSAAGNANPQDAGVQPVAPPAAPSAPRDLFQENGITDLPSVDDVNNTALNSGVRIAQQSGGASGSWDSEQYGPPAKNGITEGPNMPDQVVQNYASSDGDQMNKLAQTYFTPDQLAAWKNNPITFSEAFSKLHPSQYADPTGLASLYDSSKIIMIGEKFQRGETLSDSEKKDVHDFVAQQIELRTRGFSTGGNIAYIGSQVPAWALGFALADGVGKMAQTAVKKATEAAAMHAALGTATAIAARVGTTMALMPGEYLPKYGERRLTDAMAVTDKGALVLQESKESPAKSALMAFAHTGADVASQIATGGIGKYVINPVTKMVSTPLIAAVNKVPPAIKDAIYQAYQKIQPNAQISKVFTAAGWNGMLEQLGAFHVQEILNATVGFAGGDLTFDQAMKAITPTPDKEMVAGGLIAIMGGVHTSTSVAFNIMKSKGVPAPQASDAVDNMTALEKDNYVNANLPTPKSEYPPAVGSHPTELPKVQTPEFKGWFGDSRVVDNGGAPLVVYHGTSADIKSFNTSPDGRGVSAPQSTLGAWFTPDPKRAGAYAFDAKTMSTEGGNILPVYLSLQRPYEMPREELAKLNVDAKAGGDGFASLRAKLEKQGYDGIAAPSMGGEGPAYVAFRPEQIKSVFNSGKFDPTSEDIADITPNVHYDAPENVGRDSVFYDGDANTNQTGAAEKAEPPPINNDESVFNAYLRAFHNRANAAEEPYNNAVKAGFTPPVMDNTPLMMSLNHQTPELARNHIMVNTFKWDESGNVVKTGKALKAILDDVDNYFLTREPNRETRRADFEKYLVARHYLSLEKTAPEILVTDEQKTQSTADVVALTQKYGADMHLMNTLADEFVAYRNRTRDLLVGSLLTTEQRAEEQKRYPYSVPLKRELAPKEYDEAVARGDYAGLNPGSLTKRLKGSALPIKNIIHSTLRESARTIDFVMRNRVNRSIYNLREYAPDKVQETELPQVKKGTAEFKVSYDPKLRSKLELALEVLGGKVERGDPSIVGRGNLGSYTPAEKIVRLRIGTTEGTLAHEIGHFLDHRFDLKKILLKDGAAKKELQKLAEDRLGAEFGLKDTEEGIRFVEARKKMGKKYEEYIKNDDEIIANFYDAYVNSPEQVEEIAPKAKAAFEAFINADPKLKFLGEIKPSTNRKMETIKKDVYGPGDLPPNTFAFWENGEKKYVKVSKPMFESLSSMRGSQLNNLQKFMQNTFRIVMAAGALTKGATSTPEFILRNIVRDAGEATVQSGVRYNPAYDLDAFKGMLSNSDEYKKFMQAGGKFGSFMALDDADIERTFDDILKPKSALRKALSNPLEAWEKVPKASDTLTRFGIFQAAKQRGYSDVEAAQYALDATLNFPRGGYVVKELNKYFPFLNVGFLATERLVRAFKADPVTMTMRGVTALSVPAMLVAGYYLYGADDETRKEWLELPVDNIAQGRVYFKFNGEWRYIPTPYALGYLFSGVPQLALRTIHGDNPDNGRAVWETLIKSFAGAVSPVNDWSSLIPPTIKVALEDITNFDFYRERPIYSKFKEGSNVLQQDKTNAYDSETAKAIGKIFKASPALIDHTIYGLFGGTGGYALKASDYAINATRKAAGDVVPEKPRTGADVVGVSAFTARAPEGTRSNSYQGFQSNYLQAQAVEGHLKNLPNGPEKAGYQRDNQHDLSQLSQLKAASKQVKNVQKQIGGIYDDKNMSSEDKTSRIARLEQQITRIARNSNLQYNAALKAGK